MNGMEFQRQHLKWVPNPSIIKIIHEYNTF